VGMLKQVGACFVDKMISVFHVVNRSSPNKPG
jgi:hypothetical protein